MTDCLNCFRLITSPNGIKFCSCKCAGVYNNSRKKKYIICVNCKNKFNRNGRYKTAKYCSITCQKNFEWKQRRGRIIQENKIYSGQPRLARKFFIERDGQKCQICGIIKWENQSVPLVLDHVNGNSEDWQLDNLRLICCNCDAQTPFYKSKNKGNGRYFRRERYRRGLSF